MTTETRKKKERSPAADPYRTLDLVNRAIAAAVRQLHAAQPGRPHGALHLQINKNHDPVCLGCPHYEWTVWQQRIAREGRENAGRRFFVSTRIKTPLATQIARENPKVRSLAAALIALLKTRASIVATLSQLNRETRAAADLLRRFS